MQHGHAWQAIIFFLILFTLLSVGFSFGLPLGEGADEADHFKLIRFIIEKKRIPITNEEREALGHKGDASPFYHSLVAGVTQGIDISSLPNLPTQQKPERFIPYDGFRSYQIYHTEDERYPFRGLVLAWHIGRLVSVVFGLATVATIYLTIFYIYPHRPYFALAVAAMAAFIPRFVINTASINDDNLAVFLNTLSIYYLVRVSQGDEKTSRFIWLGIWIGLATITKYHPIVLIFEAFLLFTGLAWRKDWTWSTLWQRGGIVLSSFLLTTSGWLYFLFSRFNQVNELGWVEGILRPLGDSDIVGTNNFRPDFAFVHLFTWIKPLFQTFWIVYGGIQVFAPPFIYQILFIPTLISLLGLFYLGYTNLKIKSSSFFDHPTHLLLALHGLIYIAIVFLRYQMILDQRGAQGRHLYPALISIAFFFVLGLEVWGQKMFTWLNRVKLNQGTRDKIYALSIGSSGFALSLVTFFFILRPIYQPDYLPIRRLNSTDTSIQHKLSHTIDDSIVLLGYNIDTLTPQAGQSVHLQVYWQIHQIPKQDYLMQLCLHDQVDQEVTCHRGYPVEGRYPTRIWEVGYTVRDDIFLNIPECISSGNYTLVLSIFSIANHLAYTSISDMKNFISLNLGSLTLKSQPNIKLDTRICLHDRCWTKGIIHLKQLRQTLSALVYQQKPLHSATEIISPILVHQNQGLDSAWYPLQNTTNYTCPDQTIVQATQFVVDPIVQAGQYHLVHTSPEPENFLVHVMTRQRNFQIPDHLPNSLNVNFADEVKLLGYQVNSKSYLPSQTIDIMTYWQTLRLVSQHRIIALHLVDQFRQTQSQVDQPLGQYYPNVLWAPGEVITNTHHLLIDSEIPPGLYNLTLDLYRHEAGRFEFLPLTGRQGPSPAERRLQLERIRILDTNHYQEPSQSLEAKLGDTIQLVGYDFMIDHQSSPDGQLFLTLYWEAINKPQLNYTVFTQLIGPDGRVWSQQDNQPQAGRYPTTAWQEGRVVDRYSLNLSDDMPSGQYILITGMYDLNSGQRLPVEAEGQRLPNDAIILTSVEF